MTRRPLPHPAWLAAALVALSLGACGGHGSSGGSGGRVSLAIRSPDLADTPVAIDVRGLRAHERVTMHARWRAVGGHAWTSSVPLRASASGAVRLRGLEAARLLWTMRPVGPAFKDPYFFLPAGVPSNVAVTLTASGRTVARATVRRRIAPPSVHVRELTKGRDGVVGFLFTPRVATRRPAAVVFGGSEGGNSMIDVAAMLAAHGYPTLALAYFGEPGLPSQLVNVPLEYFARALAAGPRPARRSARIAAMGTSRGGEPALLIGATFPRLIHGAIGLVPSATVQLRPLPRSGPGPCTARAVPLEDIPVERIDGPVLTAGAGDDRVWASRGSVERIERRPSPRATPLPPRGPDHEHAGHLIGTALPYEPPTTPGAAQGFGGSPRADAAAEADLWPHILSFFAAQQTG